jgi:hypothetical protein
MEKITNFLLEKYLFAYSNSMRRSTYAKNTCAAFGSQYLFERIKKGKDYIHSNELSLSYQARIHKIMVMWQSTSLRIFGIEMRL